MRGFSTSGNPGNPYIRTENKMKRHIGFNPVPRGYRLYVTDPLNFEGVWLPLPVYWAACASRSIRIVWDELRLFGLRPTVNKYLDKLLT